MTDDHPLRRYRTEVLNESVQGAADTHGLRRDTWAKMERGVKRIPIGVVNEILSKLPDGPRSPLATSIQIAAELQENVS